MTRSTGIANSGISKNGGVLDTSFVINWQKFKNSIILTNVDGTKKIQTRVFEVISFGEENKTE